MDRLTKRENGEVRKLAWDGEILHRLAEYEDAEEKGLLVRLPCKPYDEVFVIENYISNNNRHYYTIGTWEVFEIQIKNRDTIFHLGHRGSSSYCCVYLSEIGDKWTITREEAEKRLKELEE